MVFTLCLSSPSWCQWYRRHLPRARFLWVVALVSLKLVPSYMEVFSVSEKYSMFFSVSTLFDCCIGMGWWYTCFWLFRGGTITTRSIIFRIPNDVKGFGSRHAFPPLQSVSWDSTNESQDIPCSFLTISIYETQARLPAFAREHCSKYRWFL